MSWTSAFVMEIVMSGAVAADPAVRRVLEGHPTHEESVPLKGFADPVSFLRVLPAAGNA